LAYTNSELSFQTTSDVTQRLVVVLAVLCDFLTPDLWLYMFVSLVVY